MGAGVHLYKVTCWKTYEGWSVNDVTNLGGRSAKWYTPMRILDLSIEDYIKLLVETFNAKNVYYYAPTDYLNFCFETEKDAKTYCSYINKMARKRNYKCA